MQFITNGPDIPDELLQAHEEGRVVFFCGAGISYPAGLPGFKGLVDEIYRLNGTTRKDIEDEAYKAERYDATLDLLEHRLPGQRLAMRRALAEALKPKLRRKGDTDTQAALLRLARNREGALRLVTTNFDRIFHVAAKRTGQAFQAYAAPMPPIPKNSRWNGLVYLHGLLPERLDDTALNRLVVTSGDFGLAYLTERWAARFVSELFRNYVVCFVGYSINDPVLRYMMDALAADRMLGEVNPQAWALGDCEPGQENRKTIEWEAKGVTPILYNNSGKHSALHQTLHAWAETYRDGVQGKEAIVVKHAMTRPQESTQQDDFVGRMLWALSDKSGLPAKRFADLNPVPSLDWLLDAFSDERFKHSDLLRFGVPPHGEVDKKLCFSLVRRPAPYDRALPMQLASGGHHGQWDDVMSHLAGWLVRHLDDPRLVIWIAERGGQLHSNFSGLIKKKLCEIFELELKGKTSELDELRLHAPKAIPSPLMRTLWRLLLSGRVKSHWHDPDLYRWKGRLKREGLTATLRLELRELLAPKVVLKRPFLWGKDDSSSADEPTRIKQLVDWELALAADQVHSTLRDLADEPWKSALPLLLEDFQQLLRDALDLMRELGEADDRSDRSHLDLPSITPHRQNRGFRDWVSLIELLHDAWLAVRTNDSARATCIAQNWFELPYPTFKRLALFAASQDGCIPPEQWVNWLLADDAWWLWSTDTGREVFRLFVLQGLHLAGAEQQRLETAILAGPPREMYRDDLEEDRRQDLVARSVWQHLAKLNTSGVALGASAAARLAEISNTYPQWQLATNERDEFSYWISGISDLDYEESCVIDLAPKKRQELIRWLKKPASPEFPENVWSDSQDNWRDVCEKHPMNALYALTDLGEQGDWLSKRWNVALNVWGNKKRTLRMWGYVVPWLQKMPDTALQKVLYPLTWWMRAVSKCMKQPPDEVLRVLCRRILALPLETDRIDVGDPVGSAINHPIGHATWTLIDLWLKRAPNDNDCLPEDFKLIFTELCNSQVPKFRHARVLMGAYLVTFYRVDPSWTEQHLLPLFSWNNSTEAQAVWQGFLWAPRAYPSLLMAFKTQLLECVNNYANLGNYAQQFVRFLTYVALNPPQGYTVEEFRSAICSLSPEGLEESAQALSQAVDGAADQREDYWKNRAQPFWQKIWPKSRDLATRRIAESLSRMVISTRDEFPSALEAVKDWLQPIEHPHYVVHLLHDSDLCRRYPADALSLLNALITDQPRAPQELGQCLDQIVQAAPNLEQDVRYKRLHEYVRRRR
jgi:hypothetical protein